MMRQLASIVLVIACWGGFTSEVLAQGSLDKLEKRLAEAQQPRKRAPAPAPGHDETGYLGLFADDGEKAGKGVRIVTVNKGGPAATAGLKANDLVTSIDDRKIATMDDFAVAVGKSRAGGLLIFDVKREQEHYRFKVTLGQRPAPPERPANDTTDFPLPPAPGKRPMGLLGVVVEEVTPDVQAELELAEARGAVVVRLVPGAASQKAGVPLEAVIVAVDGERVDSPDDLRRLVAHAGPGAEITLSYQHQGKLDSRKVRLANASPSPPPLVTRPEEDESPTDDDELAEDRIVRLEQRVYELEARLIALERLLRSAEPARRGNRE
jgi:S1-C subfamily serine protease